MSIKYRTIDEIRRANLQRVIDQVFGGMSSKLAVALDVPQTQITRCLSDAKTRRNIGDALARDIEAAANLPVGWLDNSHEDFDALMSLLNDIPEDRRHVAESLLRALAG